MKEHYGIVVDSGSSGSRVQIYAWPDAAAGELDSAARRSVPQLRQEEGWSFKTSPGVSTYGDDPDDVWEGHYGPLFEHAQGIIPRDQWSETPVFVLATAGMRLLPERKRERLLQEICRSIDKSTEFKLDNCAEQVQIIDGETEGLYGWVGLNYLMGQLDNYSTDKDTTHSSYGFMDMGGASTQISFVPSKKSEIEKHRDDISTLYLRNVDGSLQQWDVFVSTWLGFGANEARKRYLKNLINILPEKNNNNDEDDYLTTKVNDPCLPKGAQLDFLHDGHSYDIVGSGNFEQCLKTTYPLLLKNLPCIDEPCLFNGVHAPEIDFDQDKFVGISEYWYTANDVFQMGGEYNFHNFSEKVKEFCESDWGSVVKTSEEGGYNGKPLSLVSDACFKANWVLNVLHEGFNLPRVGLDKIDDKVDTEKADVDKVPSHIPFQSAGSIKGSELSWTLGRMLLYASAMVPAASNSKTPVGIQPAENEHKPFISGGITAGSNSISTSDPSTLFPYFFLFMFLAFMIYMLTYRRDFFFRLPTIVTQLFNKVKTKYTHYRYTRLSNQLNSDLEEGILPQTMVLDESRLAKDTTSGSMSPSLNAEDFGANLRTRSYANLQSPRPYTPNSPKKQLNAVNSLLDLSKFRPGGEKGVQRSQSASSLRGGE